MEQKPTLATSFLPDFCGGRIVFVVILLAELLAILLTLAQAHLSVDHFYSLAVYSMFIQWVALSCVGCLCMARQFLSRLSDTWAATGSYLITLLVSLVVTEMAWWLVIYFPEDMSLQNQSHFSYLVRCMSISAIVSALALRYFYIQHQWRRGVELEAEARFQALQSRIRPHFLFNCMNTIASLTRRDPKLAEESVEDLADLFRASLQDIHHSCTLDDEIDLCKRYLRIEQHRLGSRLQVEWSLTRQPKNLRIPSLILQPLLENAIYHGIEPLPEGGRITINSNMENARLLICVENPVADNDDTTHRGNQLAQENVRQRLAAFFADQADLSVISEAGKYSVTLTLPGEDEDPDRR